MEQLRVAVVTGSNKGIGFAIVRALCKQLDNGVVYLTSRNEERGKEAVARLNKEGFQPKFHQLDIDDRASVDRLRDYIKETYGGLDILVNNAGIMFQPDATEPFGEQATVTLATDFTATMEACRTLVPLVKPHGRVVNIASMAGKMVLDKMSKEIQARFHAIKTEEDVDILMGEFVELANKGTSEDQGWPSWAYGISKLGLICATKTFAQKFHTQKPDDDILVMACSPGYVATELTNFKGPKTVDEGADTPVYLALLPPGSTGFNGNMYADRILEEFW